MQSTSSKQDRFIYFSRFALYLALILSAHRLSRPEILRLPKCGKFDAQFTEHNRNRRLMGARLGTFKSTPIKECIIACIKFKKCKTFNFLADENLCELNSLTVQEFGATLQSASGWLYVDTPVNQTKVIISYSWIYFCLKLSKMHKVPIKIYKVLDKHFIFRVENYTVELNYILMQESLCLGSSISSEHG